MKVCVIGAGPAGLTAAYKLAKQGVSVDVYEAGALVGGMAKSLNLWGQTVDVGPHRFYSNDSRVNRLWLEVVNSDYKIVNRLTRIYYQKKFFRYPLQPMNALTTLGYRKALLSCCSYVRQKIRNNKNATDSFESFIVNRFGKYLFNTFFKTYTEKLWGISCGDLDADFAAQRIKKISLGEAIKTSVGLSNKHHLTLVDKFAYPIEGSGMVYRRMADAVNRCDDSHVYLDTRIKGVLVDGNAVIGIQTANNSEINYDHVISTMPLTHLVKSMGPLPSRVERAVSALQYRNTIMVYLYCTDNDLFRDQWLYIHDPRLMMGRLTNFRNWVPELYGKVPGSILALEYWCNGDDPIWSQEDRALIERGKAEIAMTGLVPDAATVTKGKVIRIPRSYPVYKRGYKQHVDTISQFLDSFKGITAIGRYGSFKYNNQDHSILMGIAAAENICDGCKLNLWQINTDYETYQESCIIDESGLVYQSS